MGGLSTRSGFLALQNPTEWVRHRILPGLRRARFGIIDPVEAATERPYAVLLDLDEVDDVAAAVQLARARHGDAPVIAVCRPGEEAADRVIAAFRNGVADAAVIGEDGPDDLVDTLKIALERNRLDRDARLLARSFSVELGQRARSLLKANGDMEAAYESTLHALVRALDVREKATAGHSMRVSYYTCFLALLAGAPEDGLKDLYRGSLLHDIGKIGIPDAILLKPARLDAAEFETMKTHTVLARDFLAGIDYLAAAVEIPFCHHERWDGSGYPRGLVGEDIPLSARLFALADVYDALRSRRCYKEPMSHAEAIAIIRNDSGTHFDPRLVADFESVPEETWDALDEAARRERNDFGMMLDVCRRTLDELACRRPETVS